jgi:hypothetical protein
MESRKGRRAYGTVEHFATPPQRSRSDALRQSDLWPTWEKLKARRRILKFCQDKGANVKNLPQGGHNPFEKSCRSIYFLSDQQPWVIRCFAPARICGILAASTINRGRKTGAGVALAVFIRKRSTAGYGRHGGFQVTAGDWRLSSPTIIQ